MGRSAREQATGVRLQVIEALHRVAARSPATYHALVRAVWHSPLRRVEGRRAALVAVGVHDPRG